jgi:uncharacterized protein YdiU (UPF0061 family)
MSSMQVLQLAETDMTIFYRGLAEVRPGMADPLAPLREAYYQPDALSGDRLARIEAWLARYLERVADVDPDERRARMNAVNPNFVLRNYLAQLAIDAAEQDDFSSDSPAPGCAARALRRAPGARSLGRTAAGLGSPSGRLLDVVLQFLKSTVPAAG